MPAAANSTGRLSSSGRPPSARAARKSQNSSKTAAMELTGELDLSDISNEVRFVFPPFYSMTYGLECVTSLSQSSPPPTSPPSRCLN